jgi:hypothetical protein
MKGAGFSTVDSRLRRVTGKTGLTSWISRPTSPTKASRRDENDTVGRATSSSNVWRRWDGVSIGGRAVERIVEAASGICSYAIVSTSGGPAGSGTCAPEGGSKSDATRGLTVS